jgi:cytochrome c-type biogenesis protein CcmH
MPRSTRARIEALLMMVLVGVIAVGLLQGDPTPEDRVQAMGERIKCPVCQGESIASSPSDTAQAMMDVVAEKVALGESDEQIIAYFQASYGTGILLDPPFSGKTLLVWLLPVTAAAGGIWMMLSRRRVAATVGVRS